MKKTLGKGSISLLLVVLALAWCYNLPIQNGMCFGDIVLNFLGLPTWSNGTMGLHITIFWSLLILIPAFLIAIRNKKDLFAESAMWISGLFCIGMVIIGAVILIFTGKAEAGSYQVFYGTVQDRAMAKVNEYDYKGHPYITIEQDDGTVEMFWVSDNCPEYHAELGDIVVIEACKEDKYEEMIAYSVEVVSD
jgi:hypothetical protein